MDIWTGHGGRTDLARTAFPDAPAPWLDLSTGINPIPWAGADAGAVSLAALPEPGRLAELEAAASAMVGATTMQVAAVPGSEIGLRALVDLGLPAPWRYVAPGYRTHGEIIPGAVAMAIDDLDVEARNGGTILLANPNNPDGRVVAPARLAAVARMLQSRGGWLVIDEAFADAVPEASLVPHLASDACVIVLRSFGKFFGLAGLRLGFVIGPSAPIERLRRRLGDWPVSSPAIEMGIAAYRDHIWIDAARADLAVRSQALDAALARHGLSARGRCPLFRLVETPEARTLFDRLARAGILTRPFGYAPNWLRLGLPGDDAALDRLDRALAGG